jgi:prepilin-type N-terminal cleavage/methylation domain-containing protein
MSNRFGRKSIAALTLIELMIAVVIVGLLAAVGIPIYMSYIRRSYLNEANSSIASIKTAEESYFSLHGCYISATAHPAEIPAGEAVAWDQTDGSGNTTTPAVWGNAGLAVRPDRLVRFQYSVYASNSWDAATPCAAADATLGDREEPAALEGCVNPITSLVPAAVFPTNWFFVVARGDLDGDGTASTIVSAIDDSRSINCNELE